MICAAGILATTIGVLGIAFLIGLAATSEISTLRPMTIPVVDDRAAVGDRTSPIMLPVQKLPESILVRVANYELSAMLNLLVADVTAHGGYYDADNPKPGHQFLVPAGYLERIATLIDDSEREYSLQQVNWMADPREPAAYRSWANEIYPTVDPAARHGVCDCHHRTFSPVHDLLPEGSSGGRHHCYYFIADDPNWSLHCLIRPGTPQDMIAARRRPALHCHHVGGIQALRVGIVDRLLADQQG